MIWSSTSRSDLRISETVPSYVVRTARNSAGTPASDAAASVGAGAGTSSPWRGRRREGRHGCPLARTTLCEELIVGAALDDGAVVDGEDDVGVTDRREPVGDGDGGAALDERHER